MSQVISKVLSPAMQFWLRSQVDQVETLQLQIQGSDRQILGGYVPGVMLNSHRAIYQGVHLKQVKLTGENIRINIAQVLKGKPLQLLEAIRVSGEVEVTSEDLQASLPSTLLEDGFRELLVTLLEHHGIVDPGEILENYELTWEGACLAQSCFVLQGILTDNQTKIPLTIKANLSLIPPQALRLSSIEIQGIPGLLANYVEELEVDLGSDVALNALSVQADKFVCQGELLIRP